MVRKPGAWSKFCGRFSVYLRKEYTVEEKKCRRAHMKSAEKRF